MQRAKKLKQEEKKVILAYAQLKLKANRLAKELDTMKQNVVDCFERTNQNLIIVTDTHGNNFGLQKINRKRKKFETANFKIAHNDLFNKFCTEIQYQEYKAIGGIDGLQAPKEQSDDE
jgi:poly-gamma-glutamate capsule biosynthesis protein CapA/YwtB (metallophosphatase superfamily)